MSKYTTGEIAKLCGVTVRTVQYFDSRNILVPSELSEGGRRLYSEADLRRMKIICFLRELGLPIQSISQLLSEEHPEEVIDLLLKQQEQKLRDEVAERQEQLGKLSELNRELKGLTQFTVESIGDIVSIMENKKKLRRIHGMMLVVGLPLEIIEWGTFFYGLNTGIWWPFLLGLCAVIGGSIGLSVYYYKNVKYICPKCHEVFEPGFREMLFARHTPNTRKLTCCSCGHRGFCVEVYGKKGE